MNVKEILIDKNIPFDNKGRDYVVRCLNPDHDDSSPSMKIDKITGIFGCFSCGYSGDIFKYFDIANKKYLDIKVMSLSDKINKLIWSKPMEIPLDAVPFNNEYRDILGTTYEHFEAFTSDSNELDMGGRLIFPIRNMDNSIVSFEGRYIHSDLEPRYDVYPSGATRILWPPKVEIVNNSIILVEGLFDVINTWDKGLKNVVCTFGTQFGLVKKRAKRQNNIDRLLQYKYQGVDTIYIMYDGDKSGRDAADGLLNYLSDTFIVKIIELDDNNDPGMLSFHQIKKIKQEIYG